MTDAPPYHLFTVESTPESATVNDDGYYVCERDETVLESTAIRSSATGDTQWACPTCDQRYWLGPMTLTADARNAFQKLHDILHPEEVWDRAE